MGIEAVSELIAVVLALSLATERLLLAIRTPSTFLGLIPLGQWLNNENSDPNKDGFRRLIIQILTLLCAIFTAGWLADKPLIREHRGIETELFWGWNPFDSIQISSQTMPLLILALLATGGSSFWKNILGYTKTVRDIRKVEKNNQIIHNQKLVREKQLHDSYPLINTVLEEMEAKGQPSL